MIQRKPLERVVVREDQSLTIVKRQRTIPGELELVRTDETSEGESSQWVRLQ